MICPHCEKSLLRRERTGNRCSHCRRHFALDPKTNGLQLNDLKVRRVASRLTKDGQVPCTPGHLWYALSRKPLETGGGERYGCGCAALFFGGLLGLMGMATEAEVVAGVGGGTAVLGGVLLLVAALRPMAYRGLPPMRRDAFRTEVIKAWRDLYGRLPDGMVDDKGYPDRGPAPAGRFGGAILCPDPSIAHLLAADGLPARYGLALVADPAAIPAAGPVIVLHDADAHGLLLVRQVRAALPERRVVDAGLTLRAARRTARVTPYRSRPPGRDVRADLVAGGVFSPEDLRWLSRGWVYPLVGLPPARLLAGVARVADRVTTSADPQRRRAAAVGFLTWPEAGR